MNEEQFFDVAVLGAGIVGTVTALRLALSGHKVCLIDKDEPCAGTSAGNAGVIASGAIMPLGTPKLWKSLPGMLLTPNPALKLSLLHLPRMLPWLMDFAKASRPREVKRISNAMATLSQGSLEEHLQLADIAGCRDRFRMTGYLKIHESQKSFDGTAQEREWLNEHGIGYEAYSAADIRDLEPNLAPIFTSGYTAKNIASVDNPKKVGQAYFNAFLQNGGTFKQTPITNLHNHDPDQVEVTTVSGAIKAKKAVITLGAFSGRVAKKFGVSVKLDTERGYHAVLQHEKGNSVLSRPVYFSDRSFVLTPTDEGIRMTIGAELAGLDAEANYDWIKTHIPTARRMLPGLSAHPDRLWLGYRPSTPDSLPVIGPAPKDNRIIFAYGHAHLGLTHSAKTARIVELMVANKQPNNDLSAFAPAR
jgi:D-amino-acid dehydrogenase